MKSMYIRRPRRRVQDETRRGNIVVLTAAILVMIFAFTAFAVDVGYIVLAKAELQKSTDAATLAASLELQEAFGAGGEITPVMAEAAARQAAVDVAAANRAAGKNSAMCDPNRDVRIGNYSWDADSETWVKQWGVEPYNLVEVTLRRDQDGSLNGDEPLDLFFAPIMGNDTSNIVTVSTAAMLPAVGFRKVPGTNIGVLPITLDVPTWDNLILNGVGTDDYSYDPETKTVGNGSDGIKEVNLYPTGNPLLPPGNRGTVDFGGTNNSTADLARQILNGLNDDDWAALAEQGITELRWDTEPLQINGDTGLSAGIKDELNAIKGLPRAIPLFTQVSGPGNNAMYTIVRFVGIRIMHVRLTGKPSGKHVMIQPAPFTDFNVIPGESVIEPDSILAPTSLVQ